MLRGLSDYVRVFQLMQLNEQKFTFARRNTSSTVCNSRKATVGKKSNTKRSFYFIRKHKVGNSGGNK